MTIESRLFVEHLGEVCERARSIANEAKPPPGGVGLAYAVLCGVPVEKAVKAWARGESADELLPLLRWAKQRASAHA